MPVFPGKCTKISLCVCVHVQGDTCLYICVCHVHACGWMCVYHAQVRKCVCACTHRWMYIVYNVCSGVCLHMCVCMRAPVYTCMHTCTLCVFFMNYIQTKESPHYDWVSLASLWLYCHQIVIPEGRDFIGGGKYPGLLQKCLGIPWVKQPARKAYSCVSMGTWLPIPKQGSGFQEDHTEPDASQASGRIAGRADDKSRCYQMHVFHRTVAVTNNLPWDRPMEFKYDLWFWQRTSEPHHRMELGSNRNTTLITKGGPAGFRRGADPHVSQAYGAKGRHLKHTRASAHTHAHAHGCDTGLLENPVECFSELFRLDWLDPKYLYP